MTKEALQLVTKQSLDEDIANFDVQQARIYFEALSDALWTTNNLEIAKLAAMTTVNEMSGRRELVMKSEDIEEILRDKSATKQIVKALYEKTFPQGVTPEGKDPIKVSKDTQQQQVIKALNEEQRISVDIVAEPYQLDGHNNWYSEETIRVGEESFKEHCMGVKKANIGHAIDTEDLEYTKSWIQEFDCSYVDSKGAQQEIKKGTWLVETQFHSDFLWQKKKSGELGGVSINALGVYHNAD